jgi:hypothetical protein
MTQAVPLQRITVEVGENPGHTESFLGRRVFEDLAALTDPTDRRYSVASTSLGRIAVYTQSRYSAPELLDFDDLSDAASSEMVPDEVISMAARAMGETWAVERYI